MFHHHRFTHHLWTVMATILLVGFALNLASCGEETADTPAATNDVAEIRITGDDQMRFNINEFTVRPGQSVRLTLEHVGQMGIEQMGHNVVILEANEDPIAFGTEVGQQGGSLENEYLPEPMRDRVIASTDLVGGGGSDTIEFTAPDQADEYPYLCTFPGHYVTMRGVTIVQE